jgi:hypothetical protein
MSQRREIAYDVPQGFVEADYEGVTVIGDLDNEIGFFIKRCEATEAAKAISELEGVLGQFFQEAQVPGEPEQGMFNDIPATQLHGTATFQGRPCLLAIRWLQLSDSALFAVTGAVLTEKKDKWRETFERFLGSIRRSA